MKVAIKTKIKFQLLVVALFASQLINAQDPGGFDDDIQDVPAAPINDWIIPILLVATCLLFYIFKKRKPSVN